MQTIKQRLKNFFGKASEQKETLLFLDDLRIPREVFKYTGNDIYRKKKWHIVRDAEEFIYWIESFGLPDLISFDHDLADTHYTPPHLWDNYEASKAWQDKQKHKEKTGYDCAKWLINYCQNTGQKLPEYLIHSMNPVGADNIRYLLINYENFIEKANL
jgi:hypothetical protein